MKYKISPITTLDELYRTKGAPTGNVIVDAFVEYLMHSNSRKAQDAALCLGVETRWLSESLRIFIGMNLSDAILEWRMRKALDLMDDEQLSLEEIAHRCSYSQFNHFAEAFQKRWGVSPYTYRTGEEPTNALYDCNKSAKTRRELFERIQALKNRNNPAPTE